MNDAVLSTLIGVLGTGLIGMFYIQLQNLRADMKQGFREQGERLARIETDHGERLARIEAKLDIDPPAEAA
ncbi:hypothetical protein [Candidatus Poriferisocius sp.]|uniref:hypothetical protein n=1 Tax=Candidatus Poriferisocius sp. TaxID=3101276 RepID=UPI003B01530C